MTSNCHPRSRCQASWDLKGPRAAERAGSFILRVHARGIATGWCCSGGQVLAQRWRHIARSTLETETLAQPDRGRSQGAECGDIDRLAVHHARLEQLCLHGGSREAARSRPPMSATKALTRSRKRRAEAERPSRPGNRSLWFVTAERVREGNSSEGDDMASITGRSRGISGTYARCEHKSSVAGQSCQKFLKRVGASSV